MNRRAVFLCTAAVLVVAFCTTSRTVFGQVITGLGPVDLVKYWYKTLGGASGPQGFYNGSVGSPAALEDAYRMLDPSFKSKTPLKEFEDRYVNLTNVKLLQAQPLEPDIDNNKKEATVFVEEQRIMVFDQNGEKVPAMAWYQGTVHVSLISGHWQITALDLTPEDIVSLGLGGHQPWRSSADAVALFKVAEATGLRALPTVDSPDVQLHICRIQPRQESGFSTVAICTNWPADRPYDVRLVQLHSEEWHVLSVSPVAPGAR